jgi:hypothetical protein
MSSRRRIRAWCEAADEASETYDDFTEYLSNLHALQGGGDILDRHSRVNARMVAADQRSQAKHRQNGSDLHSLRGS